MKTCLSSSKFSAMPTWQAGRERTVKSATVSVVTHSICFFCSCSRRKCLLSLRSTERQTSATWARNIWTAFDCEHSLIGVVPPLQMLTKTQSVHCFARSRRNRSAVVPGQSTRSARVMCIVIQMFVPLIIVRGRVLRVSIGMYRSCSRFRTAFGIEAAFRQFPC